MRTILRTITACLLCACLLGTGAVAETATLTGTGSGNSGEITVQVTLTDEAISDVQVLSHSETLGISDPAIEQIPAAIVAANSADVDIVSGATNTSRGSSRR